MNADQQQVASDPNSPHLPIDRLIELVRSGGKVRTGVDVFNKHGLLLLEKSVLVEDPQILVKARKLGAAMVPVSEQQTGGLWDRKGRKIALPSMAADAAGAEKPNLAAAASDVDRRINEIMTMKKEAAYKYEKAKSCIKEVLESIRASGGEFDPEPVAATVNELVDFVSNSDNTFAYLTREIFSYDDYLYNHSINVCTIGTVVMQRFSNTFGTAINTFLNLHAGEIPLVRPDDEQSFVYYTDSELRNIAIGYFMHDLGKVMVAPRTLNKTGKLTPAEFAEVRSHVTDKASLILEKNKITDPHIVNVCRYHHAGLFRHEPDCYPEHDYRQVPTYVKVCKLADIYDAMTSKRCYKEAMNPVGVVTDIFHHYAGKNPLLQYVLHSFVKSVGIYPAGSVVTLTNGQLAYVLDSNGPTLLPVTDTGGIPLSRRAEVIIPDQNQTAEGEQVIKVDRRRPPISPLEAFHLLPGYLRRTLEVDFA
ncbi:HD-GYP domain-containing protein [Desulfurivibrio alkaliphilus]|uniref:Putative metal dependent phosphohydrolase n=1 Tax=Desulfurivibrio alkaliphilus (strain DSM 19089 / UNIQEM U267 / AHT2) TaxID=589865 RepID=D6Z6R6_DESAT|nr:HD domain-containing protein [Desulfurivibrio alkaliphilus]ADH85025.1 putative metal dependent phosphohydrolase [Desulfurivibrio alkaliphilus AHT 2]